MKYKHNKSQKEAAKVAYKRAGLEVGDIPTAILTNCILTKIIYFDFNHADKNRISVLLKDEEDEMDLSLLKKPEKLTTQTLLQLGFNYSYSIFDIKIYTYKNEKYFVGEKDNEFSFIFKPALNKAYENLMKIQFLYELQNIFKEKTEIELSL